jgi:hypothetical protein
MVINHRECRITVARRRENTPVDSPHQTRGRNGRNRKDTAICVRYKRACILKLNGVILFGIGVDSDRYSNVVILSASRNVLTVPPELP